MHDRCSPRTLGLRYHGPVGDADRYLGHLLSPRFGRTLAVQTAAGRIVGLGHLLWDGDETEVALLVEDAWQRRGIGAGLLARLVAMAAEAGCAQVYAVTQASNTAMVAAMRRPGPAPRLPDRGGHPRHHRDPGPGRRRHPVAARAAGDPGVTPRPGTGAPSSRRPATP
ncbi:hypothetical protein SFUMM280S_01029 [Streptomyces fumanus]